MPVMDLVSRSASVCSLATSAPQASKRFSREMSWFIAPSGSDGVSRRSATLVAGHASKPCL